MVQIRDRGYERKTESVPLGRGSMFRAIGSQFDALALAFGYSRTIVGDDQCRPPSPKRLHDNLRSAPGVPDGVFNQVDQQLGKKFAVARNSDLGHDGYRQLLSGVFR